MTAAAHPMWLVIPRWDEHQHPDVARSKVPPWIKTYTKLMSDDDFLELSFHLRGILTSIWLEYATARRQLIGSTSALSRRLGHRVTTRDLQSLNDAGFIEFSASKPASTPASKVASTEVDREKKPPYPLRGTPRKQPFDPLPRAIQLVATTGDIDDGLDYLAGLATLSRQQREKLGSSLEKLWADMNPPDPPEEP